MTMITRRLSAILFAGAASLVPSAVHASGPTETFSTLLGGNFMHVAPFVAPNGTMGVVVEGHDGSFMQLNYGAECGDPGWCFPVPIPGGNALGPQGLSVAEGDGIEFVAEVESNGLWLNRSHDSGSTWDGWCQIDSGNDIVSAPSIVYLTPGVQIFARTQDGHLRMWGSETSGAACSDPWPYIRFDLGETAFAPAAVSWGADRYDVFATTSTGILAHWWNPSANEDPYGWGYEASFAIGGGSQRAFQVRDVPSPISAIGWVDPYKNDRIDVLFHEYGGRAGDSIQHLYYRGNWWLELADQANYSTVFTVSQECQAASPTACTPTWRGTTCNSQTTTGDAYWTLDDDNGNGNGYAVACEPNLQELRSTYWNGTGYVFATDGSSALYWLKDLGSQ
jgi:hypothetical protein